MSRKNKSGRNKNHYKFNRSSQQFPIAGSNGSNLSPIQGGGSNRNFPSASTGDNPQNFRPFSRSQVERFCNYNPKKDFNRCLRESLNAVPSAWTRAQAEEIRITGSNIAPIIRAPIPRISEDLWTWDMWPLTEKDGSIAVLPGGWRVLFVLSAPRSVLPNNRHDVARIAYFYSRDGANWIQGGPVFAEGTALGSRQWAGSTMIDNGRIYYFYTASGRRGESQITYEQRIAFTSSSFVSNLDGVYLVDFAPHEIILEPDGVLYQTLEQSEASSSNIIYAFRDPYFFKDPASGCEYLLFEGNIAGNNMDIDCGPGVPEEASQYTGNIGIALLRNNSFTSWQLLPALLEAGCTNQQTERPHIVVSNGIYYLFTDSHMFTFAPGLENGPGPDGLYGFAAGSLRGNYRPLNDGGLVVANPPQEPNQAYSWLVLPDFSVLSFVDTFDLQGITTEELATLPESFQIEHFGGTLAPTLQLRVSGRTTEVVAEYEFGLVMVSETESPKCCRKGAESPDDGHMHGGGGCRHPKPGHGEDCEDNDHGDGDCGCHKNHHDHHCDCEDNGWDDHCEDDDWDDDDNDCGCQRRHHGDCDEDDHNSHGRKNNKGKNKNKCKDPDEDCIVFPTPDRNRFHNQNNCGCRNN